MDVVNDIRAASGPPTPHDELALRRLETVLQNADRQAPPPPAAPDAVVELSAIAARLLRSV
jgi:hypothetical protein